MRRKALHPASERKAVDISGFFAALAICLVAGGTSSILLIASWNLLV
jgi:hypothetical protein